MCVCASKCDENFCFRKYSKKKKHFDFEVVRFFNAHLFSPVTWCFRFESKKKNKSRGVFWGRVTCVRVSALFTLFASLEVFVLNFHLSLTSLLPSSSSSSSSSSSLLSPNVAWCGWV